MKLGQDKGARCLSTDGYGVKRRDAYYWRHIESTTTAARAVMKELTDA